MFRETVPKSMSTDHQFEELLATHKDAVYRQMVRVCGNYDDADDALAEAMLRAYRAMDSLRDPEQFRAWLAMIGRRVCSRMHRRPDMLPLLELAGEERLVSEEPSPELIAEANETKDCIVRVLSGLPDEYRDVYEMRELQQMSGEEVAEKLGLSLAAMKSRLHRAREWVRSHLDDAMCGV